MDDLDKRILKNDLDKRILKNNPDLRECVALRKAIGLAYHQRWCGIPLSCGGTRPCNGEMDPQALDLVMFAIPVVPVMTTADDTQGVRRAV